MCYVVWNNGWAQPAMGVSIIPTRESRESPLLVLVVRQMTGLEDLRSEFEQSLSAFRSNRRLIRGILVLVEELQ